MAQSVLFSYPTVVPAEVNDPATTITLSASSIADNAAQGTVVGTLSHNDPDDVSGDWSIDNTDFQLSAASGATVTLQRSGTGTLTAGVDETVNVTFDDGVNSPVTQAKTITVSDSSAETLLETVTLSNFSGASRTPVLTFRRSFESGAVPSGSHVELRKSDGTTVIAVQQYDAEKTHADGSLKDATFSAVADEIGAVADNGTFDITLYKVAGAKDNGTALAWTAVENRGYRIKLVISGTGAGTFYCVLNNLITAGTYETLRSGQACIMRRAFGVFRNGTGASDTDQGQFQGYIYAALFENGRIAVYPEHINGRLANGATYTVDSLTLEDGSANALFTYTTDYTAYGHEGAAAIPTHANPFWDDGTGTEELNDFWAHVDAQYFHDKKLAWYIQSTPTQVAAIGSGTAIDYVPGALGELGTQSLNSSGANWPGPLQPWQVRALLTNDKTRLRNDRVNALSQYTKQGSFVRSEVSGYPPVLVNEDYTASGLTSAQTSVSFRIGAGETWTDPAHSTGSQPDPSHMPNWSYFQYVTTGWEWWADHMVDSVVGMMLAQTPGTSTHQRNPIINGNQYYGAFLRNQTARAVAWEARSISDSAWVLADDHKCAQYMQDALDEGLAAFADMFTSPQYPSTHEALGIWQSTEAPSDCAVANWMHGFTAIVMMMLVNRGQMLLTHPYIAKHVTLWDVGKSINGCAYGAIGVERMGFVDTAGGTTADSGFSQAWTEVWTGTAESGGQTTPVIPGEGCPTSGIQSANSKYIKIDQAMAHVCAMMGITGADTLQAYHDTYETSKAGAGDWSESAWADFQFRIREPA